ncbi:30S ribosomal protein S7 [Candidatus Dojkabacteria bacterium]|nr:30S ribosomal protein S7 [Candidatus Dojkabacteria bacterium]
MRGKRAKSNIPDKDVRYQSELAMAFINKIMLHGKKSLAERLFYSAIEGAAKQLKMEPMDLLNEVVVKVSPSLEVRSRRVGGANYQIPVPVSPRRQITLVIRWIVDAARSKVGAPFDVLLKREFIDAYNEHGDAFAKKISVEKMAEANKAFAHFRW